MADDKIIQGDDQVSGDNNILVRLLIGGQVTGNIHIGNTVYTRTTVEELRDYLARAVPACEAQLYQALWRSGPLTQPYKYLYAYELEDAPLFFGRAAATQKLRERLFQDRLMVLHAPSGTGKTSLLRAGLMPSLLREGRLPIYVRVYNEPLLALKRALTPPDGAPWPELLTGLSLHEYLGVVCGLLGRQTHELVLIFDQLEEFFTLTDSATQRQAFIQALGDCYEDSHLPVRFLLGLRDDYLADLAEFESRFPNIFHNRLRLPPLTQTEALDSICQPLRQIIPPCAYEPGLAEQILLELGSGQAQTPQLQLVCSKLFETLEPGQTLITHAQYRVLGSAQAILGDYLRSEVEKLGQNAALARAVLAELVSPENTRRQASAAELIESLFQRSDLERLPTVLASLVASRLLQRQETEGQISYELAHDYLLGQVQQWITVEDVQARQAREVLRRATQNWRSQRWVMDVPAFNFLNDQRETLTNLGVDELELLLRSAVAAQISVDVWALAALRKGLDIWPILQPALAASDPLLRAKLAQVLPGLGVVALPGLLGMLRDEIPLARVMAIRACHTLAGNDIKLQIAAELKEEVFIPPQNAIPGFYMDRYPVTCQTYARFLAACPDVAAPPDWKGRAVEPEQECYPVVGVSWQEAKAYAAWAGKRLPSAAEWRRAFGPACYPWGDEPQPIFCNTRESGFGGPSPVGSYSPDGDSPFGVADLAGNVWEWLNEAQGDQRKLLGGCWFYSLDFARADAAGLWRHWETHSNRIGFRTCFDL